ncbi:MAG: hypothetical protein KAH17_09200 [Bacteroidales bacterium]|nr:hypothetical protein [Bacteroidales bacterium]
MKIEVSNGELIDKLCILEIKSKRIRSAEKLRNINNELSMIKQAASEILPLCQSEYMQLKEINEALWDIEDRIRNFESSGSFDEKFVQTAREVYHKNDIRAIIKQKINQITGSDYFEEKSYHDY